MFIKFKEGSKKDFIKELNKLQKLLAEKCSDYSSR